MKKGKLRCMVSLWATGMCVISYILYFSGIIWAETGQLPFKGITIKAMMEPHPSTYALQKLVGEFEKKTGMRVILEEVPFEQSVDKTTLEFSQQSPEYDVIFNNFTWYGVGWSAAGYLEPLDNFINDPSIDNSDLNLDDFMSKFLEEPTSPLDGKLYGLPVYGESTFLMFRKDIFAQLGLIAPGTMDELKTAAKKISENTELYGITLRGRRGVHAVYIWTGFMQAFGGKWFDKNMVPQLNTPEVIAATDFYVELLKKYGPPGAVNYGWEENRVAFEQGHAASTIDATVNGALAEDPEISKVAGKVGYAVVPKKVEYGSSISVHSFFINKFSDNKKAAWAFIKWATSKDIQSRAFKIEPHSGVTSRSVLLGEDFRKKYPTFTDVLIKSIELGNPDYVPRIPETYEVTNKVGIAVSEVLAGVKTAKEAMEKINQEIFQLMEEAGYYQ